MIAPSELFAQLDAYMAAQLSNANIDPLRGRHHSCRHERDYGIDEFLQLSVRSYTAVWLPVMLQGNSVDPTQIAQVTRDTWRATRRNLLKVINRVSYRSALALYMFSLTPTPVGISAEEELDGINANLSTYTALLQIQQLRQRLRSFQPDGAEGLVWSPGMGSPRSGFDPSPTYLDLENRAYWAAVTWDTTNMLTSDCRSTLSTAFRGACFQQEWLLSRAFIIESFQPRTEAWRENGSEVTDDVAGQIISASGIWGMYVIQKIIFFKEVLREGGNEDSVRFAWDTLCDGFDIFKTTIRPLLDTCSKRLYFLSQSNRLNWYEINLYYYMAVLIMVDVLEAAQRLDVLAQVTNIRLEAEHESFNNIKFSLENLYTIDDEEFQLGPTPQSGSVTYPVSQYLRTSFVAIDPYPHFVILSVRLITKASKSRYNQGDIDYETCTSLLLTLKPLENFVEFGGREAVT